MKKTFLELAPEFCRQETAFFHILPIPYDGTACFGKGTVEGPEAILDVSDQMEHIDEETFHPFYRRGIYTCDPIPPAETPQAEMERVEKTVRELDLFRPDRFPIILGGEHSITAPVLRVAAEKYENLSVLQFDAHSDLRDEYEGGGRESHASAMARALEVAESVVQVGIRSFSEEDLTRFPEQVKNFVTPERLENDFDGAVEKALQRLSRNVYITVDMDAFDPAFAPGVGTPEPGGLSWRQIVRFIQAIVAGKNVVGADVVETVPLGGRDRRTEFLAARLVAKIATAVSMKKAF